MRDVFRKGYARFRILRHGVKGARNLFIEEFFRFLFAVDICVIAVSVAGKAFQIVVPHVTHAEAEHRQINAVFRLFLNEFLQRRSLRNTHVEIAVAH